MLHNGYMTNRKGQDMSASNSEARKRLADHDAMVDDAGTLPPAVVPMRSDRMALDELAASLPANGYWINRDDHSEGWDIAPTCVQERHGLPHLHSDECYETPWLAEQDEFQAFSDVWNVQGRVI